MSFQQSPDFWSFIATAAATIAAVGTYAVVLGRVLSRIRERKSKKRSDLFDAVSNGITNGTLTKIEDFVNVYKGINELGADDASYKGELSKVLRSYLVSIISSSSLKPDIVIALKEKISSFLNQIDAEAPFAEVPAIERNLITDVLRYIAIGDQDAVRQKLVDLAGHIEIRQDAFARLQSVNRWATTLAVIGLVLTVFFGVLSFIR